MRIVGVGSRDRGAMDTVTLGSYLARVVHGPAFRSKRTMLKALALGAVASVTVCAMFFVYHRGVVGRGAEDWRFEQLIGFKQEGAKEPRFASGSKIPRAPRDIQKARVANGSIDRGGKKYRLSSAHWPTVSAPPFERGGTLLAFETIGFSVLRQKAGSVWLIVLFPPSFNNCVKPFSEIVETLRLPFEEGLCVQFKVLRHGLANVGGGEIYPKEKMAWRYPSDTVRFDRKRHPSALNRRLDLICFSPRFGGMASIPSGESGGDEGQQSHQSASKPHQGLAVGQPNYGLSRVGRASLLYEIIAFEAMLLGALLAAVAFIRGFPLRNPVQPRWIAAGTAGTVGSVLCLLVLAGW